MFPFEVTGPLPKPRWPPKRILLFLMTFKPGMTLEPWADTEPVSGER